MRPVTPDDFDTDYDIYMDETVNPFMHYEQCSREDFKCIFQDLMKRDYFWLFQHNGQDYGMCGVIVGKARTSHVAMLVTLGIKKDFQGRGLGKKIVKDVINFVKGQGFIRVELQAEADNDKAISFYEKMGFIIEGRQTKFLKRANDNHYVDEIMMAQVF